MQILVGHQLEKLAAPLWPPQGPPPRANNPTIYAKK